MDKKPPNDPIIELFKLGTTLSRLGLDHYEQRLRENGFDTWESVAQITESDLAELNFKLGDRRKLQRAIYDHSSASASPGDSEATAGSSQQEAARATRPYRKRPRQDPNAPDRPKTAYVLFGEHVRQDPTLDQSSFAEIAKETGRRWRELPNKERAGIWEDPATKRLQNYREEMNDYMQTENYLNYQKYLEGFKHQQLNPGSTALADNPEPSISLAQVVVGPQPQGGVDTMDMDLESQHTNTLTKSWVEEVHNICTTLNIKPDMLKATALPPENRTREAVKAFLCGTGSLLYLWDQDEALSLVRSIYHTQSNLTPVYVTEVFAMSVIGSYCDMEAHKAIFRERFLHFSLYMLSSLDIGDLRRMRLSACLAIWRFTSSVESARELIRKRLWLSNFR